MHLPKLCTLTAIATLAMAAVAMASPAKVNVVDPIAPTRAARVDIGNRLAVQDVPPSTYFHAGIGVGSGTFCAHLAGPPSGKALIVRQVRVSVLSQGSATGYPYVLFYTGTNCNVGPVGEILPNAVGGQPIVVTWDPGLAIADGEFIGVLDSSSYNVDVYLDGYTVASSVVPVAGGQTIQWHGSKPPH